MKPIAIPLLPCRALDDVVPFYEAIGFETTMRQQRPNPYAALRWRGTDLHLFGLASLEVERNPSMCLLVVDEVEALHAELATSMRQLLGRAPSKGAPRITRMTPGQSRFTLVDPAGNSILFIRRDEPDPHEETRARAPRLTALGKAIRTAEVLRDYKNDDDAARKVLEVALAKAGDADPAEIARARAMRDDLDA